MKKIKILEIINDATVGGGQLRVLTLLRKMDRRRFTPCICCSPEGDFLSEFRDTGAEFFAVHLQKKINLMQVWKLRQIIKNNSIDIVHTHGGIAGLWGRLAQILLKNVQTVHTLHGIHYLHYENKLVRRIFIGLERLLSLFTNKIICVSDSDKENALKNRLFDPEKCVVIKNGIHLGQFDLSDFDSARFKQSLSIPPDKIILGHVARLHYEKGQKYLLQAFSQIQQQQPNTILLLVGDGPMKPELEALVRELHIEEHVRFAGERKDIPQLLSIMDIFLFGSLWEGGVPFAIQEAMAAGKPIVATRVGGIKEIIEDQHDGILVPEKNPAAIADATLRLLNHPEWAQQLGQAAVRKITTDFSDDTLAKNVENIYLELVRG